HGSTPPTCSARDVPSARSACSSSTRRTASRRTTSTCSSSCAARSSCSSSSRRRRWPMRAARPTGSSDVRPRTAARKSWSAAAARSQRMQRMSTMWEREDDRLALLELLVAGTLRRRAGQAQAWALLADAPWTRRTRRRDELGLVPQHEATVVELLDRVWPDWRLAADALAARGLRPTPAAWRQLQDGLRAEDVARL